MAPTDSAPAAHADKAHTRLVYVGIGGASCSGKTSLATHLLRILPSGSFIVHQDDFAPPDSAIPFHPVFGQQDWDDPDGAVDWTRFRAQLQDLRAMGRLPPDHVTYDYLVQPDPIPVDEDMIGSERERFHSLTSKTLLNTTFVLVDGFLAFWDESIDDMYAIRMFVREDKDVLRQRRTDHKVTAESFWVDPPGYFDNIVWPAYTKAHASFFTNADVQDGTLSDEARAKRLLLLEARTMSKSEQVLQCSQAIYDWVQQATSRSDT